MPRSPAPIFPREEQQMRALGQRLRSARLRRGLSMEAVSARVGVTPKTYRRLERGDPAVSLALLVRALTVLGLNDAIDAVVAEDPLGQRLAEAQLRVRPRARRSRAST